MLLLDSAALAASPDPRAFGLLTLPDSPADVRIDPRKHRERAHATPALLVPMHAEDLGWGAVWDQWHDGEGHVYTLAEVETILLADPASAPLVKQARAKRIGGLVGGSALAVGGIAVVAATAGTGAAIVGPMAVFALAEGGFGVAIWGMAEERAAVRAYNLAHAPEPEL